MRLRNRLVIIGGAVAAVAVAAFLAQVAVGGGPGVPAARGGDDATWTTVFKSTFGLEGLTGDNDGFLYSTDRGGSTRLPGLACPGRRRCRRHRRPRRISV